MKQQWPQFDHHDTLSFKLTDDEERELIESWQKHSDKLQSFDDVIIEAQKTQNVRQGV